MTDLGALLVLLHGARGRVTTVRATVRTWQHTRRAGEALERSTARGDMTAFAAGGDEPETHECLVRVWLAPPDRVREEREDAHGSWLHVSRGPLWWSYSPHNGALTNEDRPEIGGGAGDEFRRMVDPGPVMGLLDFEDIAAGRRAGRDTLRVRAVPRAAEDDDWPLVRLNATGADELLLDVDAERGALLRIECRFQGRPFVISEVLEIAFDEAFDDGVFVFTPPPGEPVRSVVDEFSVRHGLTIEQAVALAPFAVWIAARVPAGWETEIAFAAERERPAMAPHVHLHCRATDGTHGYSVAESPAGHAGEHSDYEHARPNPWREVERDGRRLEVREPAESWQPAQVRLELDGTRILIHSTDLAAGALTDLAAGLVRAPSEPPDLGA